MWSHDRELKHAAASFLVWHALAQARLPSDALDGPAAQCGDCGCVACEEHVASTREVTLRNLLEELPLLHDVAASASAPPVLADAPLRQLGLFSLDESCLCRILAALDRPADLRAAALSCRAFAALSRRLAPGLRCTLYAHQQAALDWMLRRELPGKPVPAPLALAGGAGGGGGLGFVAVAPDGPVLSAFDADGPESSPLVQAPDARGGFYCDEPGLGKTVTVLALVLRTRGAMAEVPPDAAAAEAPAKGPPAWYDVQLAQRAAKRGAALPPPRRIVCTRATLGVVPGNLITHWLEQAELHAPQLRTTHEVSSVDDILDADLVLMSFEAFSKGTFAHRSPLLDVRWLRIVLDEGHIIWSPSITNRLDNLCLLHADRRWIMTGTPAPERAGTGLAEAAKTLLPLLKFIRDPQYGCGARSGKDDAVWKAAVIAPLAQGRTVGVERLRRRLGRLLARATKACLARDLPPCVSVCTRLDFTPAHAAAYNQLVLLTMRTLLLADWNDPNCAQSLLHRDRTHDARIAVAWVRQACSVVGTVKHNVEAKHVQEALAMLQDADSEAWRGIRPVAFADPRWAPPSAQRLETIRRALQDEKGGTCELCGEHTPVVLVTPCAHITCVLCGQSSQFCCPLPCCGLPYTMQHGRVPQCYVELQPAMVHSWDSQWHDTRSAKVRYVLDAILAAQPGAAAAARARASRWRRAVAAAVGAADDAHTAAENAYQAANDAYQNSRVAAGLPPAPMPPGMGPPPPRGSKEGKCRHAAIAALRQAFAQDDEDAAAAARSHVPPPPKFILYSPFLGHLQLFATHLAAAGVRFAWITHGNTKAACDAAARQRNVAAFKAGSGVNVLLMDKAGVLGHDLSCASRVFLLEPLRDAAEARQVVARAHRLGCTASEVRVETLAMRGTAEEQLLRLCEEAERFDAAAADVGDELEPADAPSQQHAADAARAALEAMQNREVLRALAFVRPAAGGAEQAAPELPSDEVAQHIEAILTHPGNHAKTLPPLQPQPQAAGGGHATPPRSAAPPAAPLLVTPGQVVAPPHSARALERSP